MTIEEEAKSLEPLSEEDALAFSHVQALNKIQLEIQQLRQSIPLLLQPLAQSSSSSTPGPVVTATTSSSSTNPGSTTTTTTATTTTNATLQNTPNGRKVPDPQQQQQQQQPESSVKFRERAVKVQADVKALVKNLEKLCNTLEAAEKVRIEDYNERGEYQPQDPLQRTNVSKEQGILLEGGVVVGVGGEAVDGDGSGEMMAPAIESGDFLFDERTGSGVAEFGESGPSANFNVENGGELYDDFGLSNYNDDWDKFLPEGEAATIQ